MKTAIFNSLIITLALISCAKNDQHSEFYTFLSSVSHADLNNCRKVIVIPNAGCSGCILASEQFMFDNISSMDSTYFILTAFNSVKELKAKYSNIDPTIFSRKNLLLDTDDAFSKLTVIDKRYPFVIFVNDSKILTVESLDVGNQALLDKL